MALKECVNDGEKVRSALTKMGWKCESLVNPDKADLESNISRFVTQIESTNGKGLIYFAGRGCTINGREHIFTGDSNSHSYKGIDGTLITYRDIRHNFSGRNWTTIYSSKFGHFAADGLFAGALVNGLNSSQSLDLVPVIKEVEEFLSTSAKDFIPMIDFMPEPEALSTPEFASSAKDSYPFTFSAERSVHQGGQIVFILDACTIPTEQISSNP